MVKRDHSSAEGTAARISSHAKSYIVELTDGSKWRIWPGDLATTLGVGAIVVSRPDIGDPPAEETAAEPERELVNAGDVP